LLRLAAQRRLDETRGAWVAAVAQNARSAAAMRGAARLQ
jgi:hypothetical protein